MHPESTSLAWAALVALGAVHGINPAMGWLFAVSLGLQERARSSVWGALGPLALGHALAIAAAVAVASMVGRMVPLELLEWVVAALLVSLGIGQLVRHRHPRLGGMRVGGRELVAWSFLVATAHGAGLMVVPFVLDGAPPTLAGHAPHAVHMAGPMAPDLMDALLASAVHTGGYLLVTGALAAVVYEWVGLRMLRKAWINLDLIWALALVATGVLTPLL